MTLVYRKKLPTKWMHTVTLSLAKAYQGRSPKKQRADLQTAIRTTTKIELTFRDDTGETRNHYCDIVSAKGLENTGMDERGPVTLVLVEP